MRAASEAASQLAHDHHHHHGSSSEKALRNAFFLIAGFMLVEAIGGWLANSLTLIADAGHMFLDATALGFAWYAARLAGRDENSRLSYGYHRAQVLAAFVNGLTLAALVLFILVEAWGRAARSMGYRVWILDPDPDSPAGGISG